MKTTRKNPIWFDRFGGAYTIRAMTTPHLYHTIKMLWNNVIAPKNPYGEVISWRFNRRTHTKRYLREFFPIGLAVLRTRRNRKIAQGFLNHVSETS